MRSYSQTAEDMFVLYHLKEKVDQLRGRGTYIEIGAIDGLRFSNTMMFHQFFGWTGHLIEPSHTEYEKLRQNRPNDVTWNKVVGSDFGQGTWVERNDGRAAVSGIREMMSPQFLARWHSDPAISIQQVRDIEPMKSFITRDTLPHVDFFSLDTEGFELEVLKGFDWTIRVRLLLVENLGGTAHRKAQELSDFILGKGFEVVGPIAYNILYRAPDFD